MIKFVEAEAFKATWLSWLERCFHIAEVGGSNPSVATLMKYVILICWLVIAAVLFYPRGSSVETSQTPSPTITSVPTEIPIPTTLRKLLIISGVPFTSQAPNYDWKDPRLQDGCEETSVIMAYFWVRNKPLNSDTALSEIFSLVNYQEETFNDHRDTSLQDTADRLLKGYYAHNLYRIDTNATIEKIIDELYLQHLVILPMNGQLLENPNYTGNGPERHMLLVIGYDPVTHEFITNDSGTWKGQNYRYPEDILYAAIRDYETGYHIPITTVRKPMLIVSKS